MASANPPAVAINSAIRRRAVDTAIAYNSHYQELHVSAGAGDDSTGNTRAYEALIENKPVVPLYEHIARRAGALEGQHLVGDTKPNLGSTDSIVAATGLTTNEAVVTNDRDVTHVDGLDTELY